jgi:hypothetical protein
MTGRRFCDRRQLVGRRRLHGEVAVRRRRRFDSVKRIVDPHCPAMTQMPSGSASPAPPHPDDVGHVPPQIALAANALPNSVSTVANLVRNLAPSSSATAADRRSANRRAASGVSTSARAAVISLSKLSLPCS